MIMYAIIETGGKQYKVEEGKTVTCEKLAGETGATIVFDKVLLLKKDEGDTAKIGSPYVLNAKVTAKILKQKKGEKITVFKYKSKKRYRRKTGHRQVHTQLVIESISM